MGEVCVHGGGVCAWGRCVHREGVHREVCGHGEVCEYRRCVHRGGVWIGEVCACTKLLTQRSLLI